MPAPTLSIPDVPGQFARVMPDGQLRRRSIQTLGIPLGEIPGVRRWIVVHRPLESALADVMAPNQET